MTEPQSAASLDDVRDRYIDLLKRSVTAQTYLDNELRILYLRRCARGEESFNPRMLHNIRRYRPLQAGRFLAAMSEGIPFRMDVDNLAFSYTMLGQKRIDNVEYCVRAVLEEKIPGDLIECGVWRGGAVVFMRGILAAYGCEDRVVWVADSFRGLPAPRVPEDKELGVNLDAFHKLSLAVDIATVKRAFEAHNLLDDRVQFLSGWFKDTLPVAPIERLAILRVDGDMYESTIDPLRALYDKVVVGGFIIVDDYYIPNCKKAVDDFIAERGLKEDIVRVDYTGIYWRKAVEGVSRSDAQGAKSHSGELLALQKL